MLLFNLIGLTIIFLITVRLQKQTVEEAGDIKEYYKYKRMGKILLSVIWGGYGLLKILFFIAEMYMYHR